MTVEAIEKPKKPRAASPETTEDGFVRLHITPFDPDLVQIVVPPTALPNARNISYHSIETFPEKRFGFIELPQVDADKIKKKLNGTVLKGSKMRVETARPEKRIEPELTDDSGKSGKKSKATKGDNVSERQKKRKREMGVIDGVMLDDRKVKRGWTEVADYKNKKRSKYIAQDSKQTEKDNKRKQSRSKYIETEECLLKTRMPPNEMRNLREEDATTKKKKKSSSRQVTVHEFEKMTKVMSFLRSEAPEAQGKIASEFVEGKGWVDEAGNVLEVVKEKEVPKPQSKKTKKSQVPPAKPESEDESTSESDTSSDDSSSEEEFEDEPVEEMEKPKLKKIVLDSKSESSGGDSSDSDSDSSVESDEESETPVPKVSGSASKPLKIDIPPPPTTPKAVHPLEALYKPSKPTENRVTTPGTEKKGGFSFFDADDNEEVEDDEGVVDGGIPSMPMTPYTKQDFEWRNVRSAAPTPDTVHPARMRSFFPADDDDDEMADAGQDEEGGYEEEEGADDYEAVGAPSGLQATSDFQKWFWENRRDLNRSWMTRRKTAAKEKRHRENKARASKAA